MSPLQMLPAVKKELLRFHVLICWCALAGGHASSAVTGGGYYGAGASRGQICKARIMHASTHNNKLRQPSVHEQANKASPTACSNINVQPYDHICETALLLQGRNFRYVNRIGCCAQHEVYKCVKEGCTMRPLSR